ncbi:pQP383R [African swine fever virus]|uniref:NifS-like protein n=1 Tax=African swine fever virus TaxID=10497 RepID=A0A2Z5DEN0_ASF|nr:pQP383R [African swine fever virus]AXB49526.1 pQP383R [African swine fever virus]AXB49698.1 pQP383R [African swine fever virus]AXB49869.1 pQP383R [African swine fever virus]AXB50042.1 pQP383R [African swine fever virus]
MASILTLDGLYAEVPKFLPEALREGCAGKKPLSFYIQQILNLMGCDGNEYHVLFTSSSEEANTHMIMAAVRRHLLRTQQRPHVIIGAAEPPSVTECVKALAQEKRCVYTIIPLKNFEIDPVAVYDAIQSNTCLACISGTNAVVKTFNKLQEISKVLGAIPLHSEMSDVVYQGCIKQHPPADSFSLNSLYGFLGVGILGIKKKAMQGLGPLIFGGGLRGGSPNVPGIHALYKTLTQQRPSIKKINTVHKLFMKFLKKHQHMYLPIEGMPSNGIPVEGPKSLPGYILFSVGRSAEELQKKIFTKFNVKVGRIVNLQEVLFRIKIPQKYWETLLFIQLREDLTKENIKRVMAILMYLDTVTPRGSLPPPSYSSSFS